MTIRSIIQRAGCSLIWLSDRASAISKYRHAAKMVMAVTILMVFSMVLISCKGTRAGNQLETMVIQQVESELDKKVAELKPKITAFLINPSDICAGDNATVTWQVARADNVTIDNNIGAVEPSGTKELSCLSSVTYTITAANKYGTVSQKVSISVIPENTMPVIKAFIALNDSIKPGASTDLMWTGVYNATSIVIEPGIGKINPGDVYKRVKPKDSTTYTMTASNKFGTVSATATVNVVDPTSSDNK
jgi:hypothetical protein